MGMPYFSNSIKAELQLWTYDQVPVVSADSVAHMIIALYLLQKGKKGYKKGEGRITFGGPAESFFLLHPS